MTREETGDSPLSPIPLSRTDLTMNHVTLTAAHATAFQAGEHLGTIFSSMFEKILFTKSTRHSKARIMKNEMPFHTFHT